MFRRPSGNVGFSWSRLITNAVPNFASDRPESDAELSVAEQDMLWTHQVSGAEASNRSPMTLDEGSFWRAGVTTSENLSNKIYAALHKNGVLNPARPNGIDTTRITSKFAHQLAIISIAAQRKVIGMLFFWEEEIVRWRMLDSEEAEIKHAMGGEGGAGLTNPDLQLALARVRMRRGLRPSERALGESQGGGLPEYQAKP